MSRFVESSTESFLLGYAQSFALDAHHESVTSILEVFMVSLLFLIMDCFKDSRINEVLNFSTCEAWSHLGELLGLNRVIVCNFVEIHVENVLPSLNIWGWHVNFLIKTPRTNSSGVQTILMISGTNDEDSIHCLESIKFS